MSIFDSNPSVSICFQSQVEPSSSPALDGYTFIFQLSGYRSVLLGKVEHTLRPADLLVVQPDQAFTCQAVENMPQKSILLFVPTDDVRLLLQWGNDPQLEAFFSGREPIRLTSSSCFALESELGKLDQEIQSAPILSKLSARLRTHLILVQALRSRQAETMSANHNRRRSTIDQVVAFIDANFSTNITLNGMAQIFETTSSALSRSFKKYTGMQPIAYLNQVRINAAKELIAKTEMPLSQICTRVGYDSQTYFGRVFKSVTDMTPSQYRRSQRYRGRNQ